MVYAFMESDVNNDKGSIIFCCVVFFYTYLIHVVLWNKGIEFKLHIASHNTLPDAPLFTRNLQVFNQLSTISVLRFGHTATKELLTRHLFAPVQSCINTGLFQNTVASLYNFVTAVRPFTFPFSLSLTHTLFLFSSFYFLDLYFCLLSLLTL